MVNSTISTLCCCKLASNFAANVLEKNEVFLIYSILVNELLIKIFWPRHNNLTLIHSCLLTSQLEKFPNYSEEVLIALLVAHFEICIS